MGSSGGLDEHVADQIAALDESLARVDEVFGNLSGVDYQDITKNMASLDKAKYDLTNLYAINSLFWMYLRSFGDDPKNTSIKEELDRIRRQMVRLSQIANKSKMPRLDREVANRFIRHELPVKAGVKGAVQKKLLSNLESENWEEEPMETDEGKKVEGDNVCKVSENVSRKRKHESECQVQEEIISDSDAAEVISSSSESELETSDW